MNNDSTDIEDINGNVIAGSIKGSRNITGDQVVSIVVESVGSLRYYNIDKERGEKIKQVASSSTKVSTDIDRGRIEEERIKPQSTIEGLKENEQNVRDGKNGTRN